MENTLEDSLNIHQASKFTGYSVRYLYWLSHKRRVPSYRSRGRLRFLEKDLKAWAGLEPNLIE